MAKNFTLLLVEGVGAATDISQLVSTITWSGRKGSSARTLAVKLADDDGYAHARVNIGITNGCQLVFKEGGEERFRGLVMKMVQGSDKSMTLTAYDLGIYLANNQDTFCYTNVTATEVFTDICKRFGIPIGSAAQCSYRIPELTKSSTTAFDALSDAMSLEFNSTGIRHYISCSGGKLSLLERRKNILQWVIESGENLSSYTYTQSIESIKTRVNLVSKEQTVVASAANDILEAKIGQFRMTESADESYTEAQLKLLVDSKLEEASTPARSLTVEAVGISDIISGMAVTVIIPHLGLSRTFYVDEDTHTYNGGDKHRMTLKLNYAQDIRKPIIEVPSSSSGLGSKNTEVYFRGGPYYITNRATTPIANASAGPAKIINTAPGTPHPYYLQHTDSTSIVWGWVDAGTF